MEEFVSVVVVWMFVSGKEYDEQLAAENNELSHPCFHIFYQGAGVRAHLFITAKIVKENFSEISTAEYRRGNYTLSRLKMTFPKASNFTYFSNL